jgi:hypothetical protein
MGPKEGILAVMHDLELEDDCPGLRESPYTKKSEQDPRYNCVAFAVGDTTQWWEDVQNIKGYCWPPRARNADMLTAWVRVFEIHRPRTALPSRNFQPVDFALLSQQYR